MTTICSKLCVIGLVGVGFIVPLHLLQNTSAQGMNCLDRQPSQNQVATQWSSFEVPTDIGLPDKREPGGTR